ncbi:MAG: type II toxin-antitoxin system Phd/YefM family antitoxin [Nitrospira sp.]|nr:MAG: type II toxin-antitoxin system Phd/YefM family antitoxin [Nitrospira sp.]
MSRVRSLSSHVSFSYTHGVKRESVMTRGNSAEAKKQLGQILARTARTKCRVMVTSRGKDMAADVPIEDVQLLEEIEDRLDLDEARVVLASVKREGTVAWKKIKRDLGL